MKIFKELKKLGYIHYSATTIEELDDLPLNSAERVSEQALVLRWFREKYGYFTSPTESDDDTFKKYDWLITKNLGEGKMFIKFIGYKDTYEEAELECLKKLIEICKK